MIEFHSCIGKIHLPQVVLEFLNVLGFLYDRGFMTCKLADLVLEFNPEICWTHELCVFPEDRTIFTCHRAPEDRVWHSGVHVLDR